MPLKILLIDNNRVFLSAVSQLLGALQGALVVGQAHDSDEALALAQNTQPDLVLMELALPNAGSPELARTLHQMPHPPRIVFLSMHSSDLYSDISSDLGAESFVDKAEFVVKLLPAIEALIAERQAAVAA